MFMSWIDRLGDWNPQLLRELKGRLKVRNVLIAIGLSLFGQFLAIATVQRQIEQAGSEYSRYCTGSERYGEFRCLTDAAGQIIINQPLRWFQVFGIISITGFVILLTAGSYLLINDLYQEERRGTLNFIRLSPRSATTVLAGKLLGTPILIYIMALVALPLHLWAASAAGISPWVLVGFYGLLLGICALVYSLSLLYGLTTGWLGGFQPWLGSSLVLIFASMFNVSDEIDFSAFDWFRLFGIGHLMPYLATAAQVPNFEVLFKFEGQGQERWFTLLIGNDLWQWMGLAIANAALWLGWTWQALRRSFRSPGDTLLSKGQSYGLIVCFELMLMGFSLQDSLGESSLRPADLALMRPVYLLNLFMFLVIIAALAPHRQALQDWARYRRDRRSQGRKAWRRSLLRDLLWQDKSPFLLAIGVNVGIMLGVFGMGMTLGGNGQSIAWISLALTGSLIMFWAAIVQSILMMKTSKRTVWAGGTLAGVVVVPWIGLAVLSLAPEDAAHLWLLTAFPWEALEHVSFSSLLTLLGGYWSIIGVLNFQFTYQLRQMGASSSQALLRSAAR